MGREREKKERGTERERDRDGGREKQRGRGNSGKEDSSRKTSSGARGLRAAKLWQAV